MDRDDGSRSVQGSARRRIAWAGVAGVFLAVTCAPGGAWAGDGVAQRGGTTGPKSVAEAEAVDFFEAQVRPILIERCVKCHGPQKQSSGLRLDRRQAILAGGDSGPAIVPGKPEESLLIQAVSHRHEELKMPPSGKLVGSDVALLTRWVALGAPWPADPAGARTPAGPATAHWAFQPVRAPALPAVKDRDWVRSPIDGFILARLEAQGMTPSPPADRRTLIRRATLDLWGIPPTAEEVEAFEVDEAPDAFGRLVDRLLASPRYGERWGRHWLDVARYADSKGYVFTQERRYPYAFTYRDYVVAAFNADLSYDRFLVEQLAADQLPGPGEGDTRALAAMGFLTVGRRFLMDQNEIIDDRIDVIARGLLGLTVTCARCHDHKFDPIPTEDYYSLYGVFASSVEPAELPVLSRPGSELSSARSAEFLRKLEAARQKRDAYLAARREEIAQDLDERFSRYLKAAYDLDLEPRNPRLEERALAERLNSRRLRGVILVWKRHLESSAPARDPVLAPWQAFAALPRAEFAARAAEVRQVLTDPKDSKAPRVHPLVARVVLGTTPASLAEVVDRYVALFAQLEGRREGSAARASGPTATDPAESQWESLRRAVFGPSGPLALGPATDLRRLYLDQRQRQQIGVLDGAIDRLNATDPAAPARAMVLHDAAPLVEPRVFIRGNPSRPGQVVPRRFLRVLAGPQPPPFRQGSGRLELARAIADPRNPLTARVLVNRVWQWHFGKGLVTTPSDFGLRSDLPSHPELLDYLASQLVNDDWSIKALHRRILLSRTYQQASVPRPMVAARDPENRLLWRFPPQRLDFEAMRDSVLAVSGSLDTTIGGRPASISEPPFSSRRTIYGFVDRQNLDGLYRTFDFASPDATNPRRFVTTVPQQALFLMNSPFLHDQARRLAAAVGRVGSTSSPIASSADPAEGVRRLYRRVLGRWPEPAELAMAADFLRRQSGPNPSWNPTGHDGGEPPARGPGRDPTGGSPAEPSLSPWEQLAQVLLLTNELMFMD